MSLKSSEINNFSWRISAVLISPFCSSCCCQAYLPTIIRPILRLWKLILKIVLNSPELNCSVIFSSYYLRMSKKMDYFLRNLVRRENNFPVQYQSTFFRSSEWCSVNNQQVLSFVVLLLPLIWLQNPSHSVVTLILQVDLQDFLCCYCLNQSQIYLIHEKFWPRSGCCLRSETKFWFQSVFTMQATGRNFQYGSNFCVSLDPSSWLWWSIFPWKSVFTTSHCMKLFSIVFSHEILSNFNNTQESCIHAKFTQFILLWKPLNSFFISLQ